MGERAGSVEVVIKGGRPWGFTLQGGIENRSALVVSQIEPSGKAERQGVLKVGDQVIKINDVQCVSLADALQLIDCAFRTLTILVWRSGNSTASGKGDATLKSPCVPDPKTPMPKNATIRQSARVRSSSRKSPSTEGRKCSSTQASTRRPGPKSAYHQLDPSLLRNEISAWAASQNTSVDTSNVSGEHGMNLITPRLTLEGSATLPEPLKSGRRRRLSNVSSASSSIASHKDLVFSGSEYPTQSRSQRSPRKLTKDSGYETSVPGEPDYVNTDWITVEGIKPLTSNSVSDGHTEYSRTSFQTDESQFYHPKKPSRYSHCVQNPNSKNGACKYPKSAGGISRSVSCYSSSESLSLPPANIESRHLEHTSSQHSSTESLASWSNSRAPSVLHATKSSSSFALNVDFCHISVQSQSTSRHYSNYPPYSEQTFCGTNVSPARSVPNLGLESDMVTRRFNKKPSVYEALANKSGLDFAPVIHRQPYWSRRNVFENDPTAEHVSRTHEKKRYVDDHQEAGPRSLPIFGDENVKSETDRYFNSKNHDPKRECFQKRVEPMDPFHEQNNIAPTILRERTISPPLIPTRDSSLRYRASSAHEKYPSWPVSLPEAVEVSQPVSTSNHRSNSWTESTIYPKEKNASYSRPKRMFQISTQQLHPVQEKTSESTNRNDPKGNSDTYVQSYHPPEMNVQKYKNPDTEFMDDSISKYFTLGSAYADSKWKTHANSRYNAHSPPERDTTVCASADESKSYDDEEYAKKYGDMLRYYSQSPALYGNWSRESPHTSVGDSNTPLLDRLRQERQTLPSAWQPVMDGDSPSEAGTCTGSIDSNSSSQETLKWHGSYSDLCSLNAPTSDSSVFGDSEHSSVVGADRSTSQYVPPCIINSSNSFKPEALKYKEIMTHNSLAEADEKLRNMRSIPNSPPSRKLPTFEQTNTRSAELEVTQCNVLAPTSPSKNSGIYFYENRIKMLREENRNPTGSQIFQTSFPGFSKSSCEETHEPPPAPATKPCKRFRDSFGAKGRDISNQSITCREKPHNQTVKSNAGAVLEKNDSHCGFYTAKGWPVRRTEYCGDQNRRHRVSDPELKALQKQAVLSFYHRQTALESGDWSDTKCDRSGIGPNQVETLDSPTPPAGSKSVSSGPSSFPKKPLPELPPKPVSLPKDFAHSTTVHNKEPLLLDPLSDSNISAGSSLRSSRISLVSDFSEASCSNTGQQDCGLNSLYENVCIQLVNQNVRIRESKESKAANSSNSLWLHGGGRKAHFKKIYNADETAIVKVISSEGVTIVETVEASDPDKNVVKAQIPLQKPSKPLSSSPSARTISPSALIAATSVPTSTMTNNLVNVQDPEEDEELRQIEESFQNHMKLAMLRSSSSSPELPLPPPPSSTDTEVHHTDDPLPPPPMEVSLGDYVQIQDQNTEVESPTAASRITYPQMEIFHPPNPTAEPQVIDHQPRTSLPRGLASPAATEATYENVPNSKCHFANENAAEKEFSSGASATQDLSPSYRSDLSPGLPPPSLEDTLGRGGGKGCQRPAREIQVGKEEDLEEALYVNLDLLRLQVQNGDAFDLIPNGSEMCSPVSVTNSATQTSDTTPSLPRKPNKVGKSHVELECERLSRDFVNHFGDTALRNLLLPAPNHKTMSDYMEGLLELDLEKGTKLNYRSSQVNRNLHDHVSQPPNDNNCRSNVGLPLTSAYFTTSEPKAKLLTRYCHNLEKKDWTNGIELYGRKEELITSIGKKLEILRGVQISLQEEVDQNEQLGKEVTTKVEKLAKPNELEKYKLHIEELEKIINLLLSLSGRLARAQNALLILPKEAKVEERNMLESKRDKLSEQHDEARRLKENIDRRSQQVSMFLHHYLSKDEYADYDHFIKMKSKLLMDAREIDEKIKLGEEQMAALRSSMDSHIWNGTALSLLSNGQQIILNRT